MLAGRHVATRSDASPIIAFCDKRPCTYTVPLSLIAPHATSARPTLQARMSTTVVPFDQRPLGNKICLFDVDGTLIDSYPGIREGFLRGLDAVGEAVERARADADDGEDGGEEGEDGQQLEDGEREEIAHGR